MKAILLLAFFLVAPLARAEGDGGGQNLANDGLIHKDPEPLPAKEEEAPKTVPADESPIPAVAVSVATIAEKAPGSLEYEMDTVGLLADAPVVERAPKSSAKFAKK